MKQDFAVLGKIDGVDMLAKEARYHASCRREYTRRNAQSHQQSTATNMDDNSADLKTAYSQAFQVVCHFVEMDILLDGKVVHMSMLHGLFQNHMKTTYPDLYNEQHHIHKLKQKLLSWFGDRLQFWSQQFKSELIFSAAIDLSEAVESAFEARTSETQILRQAASIMCHHIKEAQSSSPEMSWTSSKHPVPSHQRSSVFIT